MSLAQIAAAALVMLLAGVVKGVVGMGLPAVAQGLLGLMMPASQASALLVMPAMVTNLWQLAAGGNLRGLLRRLWPMLGGIAVGGWLGRGQMTGAFAGEAHRALGLLLVIYAVLGLLAFRPRVTPLVERWAGPGVGMVTGVVTSVTGVFMLPAMPFLNGLGLDRDGLVQSLGLSFSVSTLVLAIDLGGQGVFDGAMLVRSAAALGPALLGMWLGGVLRGRISQAVFRRCFYVGILAIGAALVWPGG
jgi:uncharacterized membrane protein YfcA